MLFRISELGIRIYGDFGIRNCDFGFIVICDFGIVISDLIFVFKIFNSQVFGDDGDFEDIEGIIKDIEKQHFS